MRGSPAFRADTPAVPATVNLDDLAVCHALDVRWTRQGYPVEVIAAALGRTVRTVIGWRSKWPRHGAAVIAARNDARILNPSTQALIAMLERGVRPSSAGPLLGRNRTYASDLARRCPEVSDAIRRGREHWPPPRRGTSKAA